MTGNEVWKAISRIRDKRRDEMHVRMKDYDLQMEVDIEAIRKQCPHDTVSVESNGLGWIRTVCRYCDKTLSTERLDD